MSFLSQAKNKAFTENGAISNASSGSKVLDYFAKAGNYVNRPYEDVCRDLDECWNEDPALTLKVMFYNRAVSRQSNCDRLGQIKGQGKKDEFIKSLKWLSENHQMSELAPFISTVGCFKDLWYDSPSTGTYHYFDTDYVYRYLKLIIESDDCDLKGLVAKYLPKIRSASKTNTDRQRRLNNFARGFCRFMGWSERDYRKFKSDPSNSAHSFQRDMCSNNWEGLNFNSISGRALNKLITQKGKDGQNAIQRHGLEDKYIDWIKEQPVAKFTGYIHELTRAYYKNIEYGKYNRETCQYEKIIAPIHKHTLDKQFESVLEKGRGKGMADKRVLCALDTSGSMSGLPIEICLSLGLYFSEMIEGEFKNHVCMFSDKSEIVELESKGFCDKLTEILDKPWAMGSTNFQSVIDEIVRVRKRKPEIPIEDYPNVLLVVSDMQFNPARGTAGYNVNTNYEVAMQKLADVGLPDMSIIWWNVSNYGDHNVPSEIGDTGTTLISGADPSIINVILDDDVQDGETKTVAERDPYEQMLKALDQPVLNDLVETVGIEKG